MKKTPADETRKSRRWFVIGPGLILSAVLAIQIVVTNRKTDSAPPIVEHYVSSASISDDSVPIDGINSMLKFEKKLALTSGQHESLLKLHSEWMEKSRPFDDRLRRASEEFNSFMARNPKGRVPVSEIQSHAASVSNLSGQAVSMRKVYWQRALIILNTKQKNILKDEILHGAQDSTHSYDAKRSAK